MLGILETTETFKPRKTELVRTGFDPRLTSDALFVNDRDASAFTPIDECVFERIRSGRMRF